MSSEEEIKKWKNLPRGKFSIVDKDTGIPVKVTPTGEFYVNNPLSSFGDLRVAELSPIIQSSFEYTVDNSRVHEKTEVNGGTVTQASAMAVVGTSTTTASIAKLESFLHAKYRSGLGSVLRFTTLFTSPVALTEQYIGLADEAGSSEAFKNALIVGFDGLTFGFHRFSNDVKYTVDIADWDDPLDGSGPSGFTIDKTKLNSFFIQFQYLGVGPVVIWAENGDTGEMIKAHTFLYANTDVVPFVLNPNFHFVVFTNNKATTSDMIIKSSSYGFFIEGKTSLTELQQPQFSSGEKQKTSVTTEVAIFTIRNKTTYASKTNFIDILLEMVTASIEASAANNLGKIRLVKNATLGGVPSYSDIDTTDSVMEIDTAGTTVTGGDELLVTPLAGKNDKLIQDIVDLKILLHPGDSITVAGSSANSATINAAMLEKELI